VTCPHKQISAIRLSKFLELNEDQFKDYIKATESNPWFKMICEPEQMNLWGDSGYDFNLNKFKELKKSATQQELQQIESLRRRMRLINIRKKMVKKVIEKAQEIQQGYLETGDKISLIPLTQVEISKILEIDNGLTNKIVSNDLSLKRLFPSTRDVVRNHVEFIIKAEQCPLSDEEIKSIFPIRISRRLIAQCRQELGLGNSYRRETKKEMI